MIELLFICAVGTKLPPSPPPPPEPIRLVGICGKQISLKDENDDDDFNSISHIFSLLPPPEDALVNDDVYGDISDAHNKKTSITKAAPKQQLNRRGHRNH